MNSSFPISRKIAWAIWLIASVFYAYQYVLRVMPSILFGEIMSQFHIDAATFGQFAGIYYIGYSIMHLPIGILLDRYGPRKIMTICILLTVLGMAPLIFATHWSFLILGRLLIGMGSSAAILGVFKVIRLAFREERFSRILSLSVTIGLIGAIYGGGPVDSMYRSFGYQAVIYSFAAVGVGLALATYWIAPNRKEPSEARAISNIREVFGNSKVLMACLCAGLMVGPLEGFADVWGTEFLKQVWDFDGPAAAKLPSLIYTGMCFGALILNFISEKIGSDLLTIIGAGVAMAIAFILLLSALPTLVLSFNFVMIGICSAYQILAIYKASTYVRAQIAGLTTAIANMIIMIFGFIFHVVIGKVVEAFGGAGSSEALLLGIAVIPIALMLGVSGFAFLAFKERKESILSRRKI